MRLMIGDAAYLVAVFGRFPNLVFRLKFILQILGRYFIIQMVRLSACLAVRSGVIKALPLSDVSDFENGEEVLVSAVELLWLVAIIFLVSKDIVWLRFNRE